MANDTSGEAEYIHNAASDYQGSRYLKCRAANWLVLKGVSK
jgi:hypothetical protein